MCKIIHYKNKVFNYEFGPPHYQAILITICFFQDQPEFPIFSNKVYMIVVIHYKKWRKTYESEDKSAVAGIGGPGPASGVPGPRRPDGELTARIPNNLLSIIPDFNWHPSQPISILKS
jgi:hypothetical protein